MAVEGAREEPGVDKGVVMPRGAKIREIHFLRPMAGPGDVERQKRQARSLAMRRVRKEQQWISRSGSKPPVNSEERDGIVVSIGSTSPIAMSSTALKYHHDILCPGVGLASIDPFQATAMDSNPRNSRLLHHCEFFMSR
jgi:hypothetical protein